MLVLGVGLYRRAAGSVHRGRRNCKPGLKISLLLWSLESSDYYRHSGGERRKRLWLQLTEMPEGNDAVRLTWNMTPNAKTTLRD